MTSYGLRLFLGVVEGTVHLVFHPRRSATDDDRTSYRTHRVLGNCCAEYKPGHATNDSPYRSASGHTMNFKIVKSLHFALLVDWFQ